MTLATRRITQFVRWRWAPLVGLLFGSIIFDLLSVAIVSSTFEGETSERAAAANASKSVRPDNFPTSPGARRVRSERPAAERSLPPARSSSFNDPFVQSFFPSNPEEPLPPPLPDDPPPPEPPDPADHR